MVIERTPLQSNTRGKWPHAPHFAAPVGHAHPPFIKFMTKQFPIVTATHHRYQNAPPERTEQYNKTTSKKFRKSKRVWVKKKSVRSLQSRHLHTATRLITQASTCGAESRRPTNGAVQLAFGFENRTRLPSTSYPPPSVHDSAHQYLWAVEPDQLVNQSTNKPLAALCAFWRLQRSKDVGPRSVFAWPYGLHLEQASRQTASEKFLFRLY